MRYNFDEIIDRQNTNGIKWETLQDIFGATDLLPMWVADMDFRGPEPVMEALKQRAEIGTFGYTQRPDSLYEAIAGWVERKHHWKINKEWICWSPGVLPALIVCIQNFTKPGDRIIIQPPVYPPFFKIVKDNDRELVTNPLRYVNNRYEIDFEDLADKFRTTGAKMLILCSPHNPVGRVWTREELSRIEAICEEFDALIISDEIHADLAYSPFQHIPMASLSTRAADRTIVCFAPSKTFNLAGLQSSYIMIPNKELRNAFNKTMARGHLAMSNSFAITASESAYKDGGEWLEQCLAYIRANIDYAAEFFALHIPEIKMINPEGTYLLWLDCSRLGLDTAGLRRFMVKEAKLALNEGISFGTEGEGFMRMNAACRRATIEEALQRLLKAIEARR
ncbi:putative C-S lyase [Paenibacillus sp. LMG 31456]|uniref:cysteine-S-conjugate beta-lyase n=1 Tax=Paenibacillus foliorum TaxID=2654974 RepID=A0A972GVL6_9BACL|nr:MalY/PatB family protein [Paenibacillus foliorum]NOU97714.1 putative C-S lyase [Paenibacillus foliorum]